MNKIETLEKQLIELESTYLEQAAAIIRQLKLETTFNIQQMIDGEFLCEFSDNEDFSESVFGLMVAESDDYFIDGSDIGWDYARVPLLSGIRKPNTGIAPDSTDIIVTFRNGESHYDCDRDQCWNWELSDDIVSYIEL